MFDGLRKSLGLMFAWWRFRKEGDQLQDLTEFFRRAKNYLIILPPGYEEAVVAGMTLKRLFEVNKNAYLTVITTGTRKTALSETNRSEVIRVDGGDISKVFLPRKPILQRILIRPYDVAIDLNLDFVLHAAYICKASRAPVRVGIMREHGDSFFNVQIKLNRTAPPQAVYEKFTRCLEMF